MNPLPVQRASQLASTGPQTQWLVEGLWSEQAVGILGGELDGVLRARRPSAFFFLSWG